MNQILLGRAGDPILDPETLSAMFRFRYRVFHELLRWEVPHENGMERDFYDDLDPVYMVARNEQSEVEGCWRLLPTTGPYMLRDTFPQLLHGEAAPQDPTIWEMSRLAIVPGDCRERTQVALGQLTFAMIGAVYEFAIQHGIRKYILVTSVALERLLKRVGFPIYRLRNLPAQPVGRVLTVACWVDIDEQFRQAVYKNLSVPVRLSVAA